jgi:phosphoserine phosphatase RsbU/P
MQKSQAAKKLDSPSEPVSLAKQAGRRRGSIVVSISLTYLGLTLLNLLIFWIAVGSNQIRLIGQNALLGTQGVSYEILRRLQSFAGDTAAKNALSHLGSGLDEPAAQLLVEKLSTNRELKTLIVSEFQLVSTNGAIAYSYPERHKAGARLEKESYQKALRALQLLELKGQVFYGVPDLKNYFVEIFIPITDVGVRDLVFRSKLPMQSMHEELRSLIILAVAMVAVMLLVQIFFGVILFRKLVLPIKKLAAGADAVAHGEYGTRVEPGKRRDEVATLMGAFNSMSAALGEKTANLESTIQQLDQKREDMQTELKIAQLIQQGIMPQQALSDGFITSVYTAPLETVSGDYYDFFKLPDSSTGLLITDASGHGVPAALITIMAKVYFTAAAAKGLKPGQVFEDVNKYVSRSIVTSHFLTAFYLVIHPNLTAEYACASHQSALVVRQKTRKVEALDAEGFFIGIDEDSGIEYETRRLRFAVGDKIVLYTDGLVEQENAAGQAFSQERFVQTVRDTAHLDPVAMNQKIVEEVDTHAAGHPRADDCTLIIIEITGPQKKARKQTRTKK